MEIIENALKQGRTALSEYESKMLLASYKIPVTREVLAEPAMNSFLLLMRSVIPW